MNTTLKVLCGAGVVIAWGILVYLGKAPVDPFIATLRDILIGLGVYGATITRA